MAQDKHTVEIRCANCGKKLRGPTTASKLRCPACGSIQGLRRGYVYVLSNPSMPSLCKIGCTSRTVEDRVEELNRETGVAGPFIIEAKAESSDIKRDEQAVFTALSSYRYTTKKEFFRVDVEKAKAVLRSHCHLDSSDHRAGHNPVPASNQQAKRKWGTYDLNLKSPWVWVLILVALIRFLAHVVRPALD